MTVHMVRVLCEPPKGDAENAIQNWVENYTEWDGDTEEHSISEINTQDDGSGVQYLRGDWRFVQNGEEPTNILGDLSERFQSVQGGLWHRLGYHVCDHDEAVGTECPPWDDSHDDVEIEQWGDVPAEVSL